MHYKKPSRIIFIGCGKSKRKEQIFFPAKDLYTGVLGLWRRGRKGTRGGKKMPGMMTDYIREHNLLPQAEIDHLIATAPQAIIDNQEAFENGAEIPEWHDFIEAFSEEDMGQQMPKLELAMRTVCDGCECSCVC